MLMTLAPVFGVLAGVVGVVDTIPYVRDIVRGSTRPHRGTWFIWGMLAIVVCVSRRADGASWSLVMAGTQAVLTTLIFVLAIRRGEGGLSASDGILIAIASAGMAGWVVVDEPIVATTCVIVADLIAAAMMVPKVHRDPGSETLVTYVLAGAGGALAAGAVGMADASLLALPGLLLPGQLGARAADPPPPRAGARSAGSQRLTRITAPARSSGAAQRSSSAYFWW
jgi:hypothetical protein